MRPTRSSSRKVPSIGAELNSAAQHDHVSEEQGSTRTQPANEDALAKIAEFIADNPNIFEELRKYFKRQGKEKT